MFFQPSANENGCLLAWLDELVNLFSAEMLTVSLMVGIRNLIQMSFELIKLALLETDLQVDHLIFGSGSNPRERTRNMVNILDSIVRIR